MDLQQIEEAANRKLEQDRNDRITAVREYAAAAKRSAEARAELAAADEDHLAKYRAAIRHGWTESDLKGFGIEPPTKKLGGRPRKPRTAPRSRTPETVPESPAVEH
ncbi:hypothetical protein SA2016_4138 (plasmid) [Sinomonas atrocyanea]|uniref:Uncharacterized protein n=1 Tax=Sinomonas atrocyanea TaxID=37927 RepID=A0A127A5P0_9MICC|nr:hypothetical protein [Sinomonas atrocyanea]AMM34790.1 hypothetical protein SA2016_4138 [Sinomonas atrocyanea]GEB64633.1 hypothetical protein SAT01_20810 [Sinomonas atrocyanea]GGG72126.1 hypothetical protein GCM10007172_25690 [Sinomonas atrocyanea]